MSTITSVAALAHRTRRRVAATAVLGTAALVALTACSGSSSDASATSSSSTPTPASASCTSSSLLAALPGGAEMESFDCADAGGQEWAAARVNPGNTVFFLQWTDGAWQAEDSDDVCGTASAGVPSVLLDYCTR